MFWTSSNYDYSEDMFEDTRMSFGDHLEDLRSHLWRAIKGFLVGMILAFFIGKPVLQFISRPVEEQLQRFYENRVELIRTQLENESDSQIVAANQATELVYEFKRAELLKGLGIKPEAVTNPPPASDWVEIPIRIHPVTDALARAKAERLVGKRPALTTLSPQEAFMVYFKVCIVCGIVISSPWVFWQIWSFVAVGLYPHEKRLVNVYLPFSLFLFLGGVFLCEFFVIPKALEALLWFNEWIGLEPDLRLNEWLGFAILMPLVFGASFQTPLVMYVAERLGVLTVEAYKDKRRMAWFLMAIFAALITPSVDVFSMLLLWLPLCGLYELGILLCRLSPRSDLDVDESESEEMVEV
jgi:sec-independent protein translocase protein TatC